MSAIDSGTGKYASKHCVPGYVEGATFHEMAWKPHPAEIQAILKKSHFLRSAEEKARVFEVKLYDNFMSSCSFSFLQNIAQWQQSQNYALVTLVELCSPGANSEITSSWGRSGEPMDWGFGENDGDNVSQYNMRQCGLQVFHALGEIFAGYGFLLNNQPGKFGPIHQLTIWAPAVFGKLSHAITTQITPGRPMSALMFNERKVMLLNVHSIHFRKTLINPVGSDAELEDKTLSDMFPFAYANYLAAGGTATGEEARQPGVAFSISKLPTRGLQGLFGGFISKKILEGLVAEGACPCTAACSDYVNAHVTRFILQGDFNDETGELYSVPLFGGAGKTAAIQRHKRVRSCCSDRDARRIAAYSGDTDAKFQAQDSYPTHSAANWEYLLTTCAYMGNCTEKDKGCIQSAMAVVPSIVSAGSVLGARTETGHGKSKYPFASDLILDSAQGGTAQYGFPRGYVQRMGAGTISDHDPVEATLTWPMDRSTNWANEGVKKLAEFCSNVPGAIRLAWRRLRSHFHSASLAVQRA